VSWSVCRPGTPSESRAGGRVFSETNERNPRSPGQSRSPRKLPSSAVCRGRESDTPGRSLFQTKTDAGQNRDRGHKVKLQAADRRRRARRPAGPGGARLIKIARAWSMWTAGTAVPSLARSLIPEGTFALAQRKTCEDGGRLGVFGDRYPAGAQGPGGDNNLESRSSSAREEGRGCWWCGPM
jgi:hypothetical protein